MVDIDIEIVAALTTNRREHPCTLDLTKKELLIIRNDEELTLNLDALYSELIDLQKSVKSLIEFAYR